MHVTVKRFIADYLKDIEAGDAAIFAGAGLSAPAGYVNWRELLRDLAEELDLNIDWEADLVSVAQFHVNHSGNNRNRLNQAIINALAADNPPTLNHRALARLPIATWWTTNYDQLIERALRDAGKIVDVKSDLQQLANTRPKRDAIVYKMHGDVDRPNDAVLTRDDYETYDLKRGAFTNALSGDLISKTFLFIGFSFTDPNLEHVLSRVRVTFRENQRRHFAIFRSRSKLEGETPEEYAHAKARQLHVIADLKRFNIHVLLVEDYADIDTILQELERRYRRRTVFVSASASDFAPWGEAHVGEFMRRLGDELIASGTHIATGLGLGVGNALFTGAVERVLSQRAQHIEDAIIVRPFPQFISDQAKRREIWETYRHDVISRAGVALFLFGNKLVDGTTVVADGVLREYQIARDRGLVVLPIGATGYAAESLANSALESPDDHLAALGKEARATLGELSQPTDDLLGLVGLIVKLVGEVRRAT